LSNVTVGAGASGAGMDGEQMDVDNPAEIPAAVQEKIDETKKELSAGRKRRAIPEDWATADTVSSFTAIITSEQLYPGTKSLALDASGDLVLVGGSDGIAGTYSIASQQLSKVLKATDGAINDVAWAGNRAATASSSGVVRLWNEEGTDSNAFSTHAGAANSLAAHPSGSILASVGADKSWVLYDLDAVKPITQVYNQSKFTYVKFHPDGHLLAAGNLSEIAVYDVRSASIGANLGPLAGPVSSLDFSENGFWLAVSVHGQSAVEIWDLRKMAQTKSLDMGSTRVGSVKWDYTGQFLAAAGPSGVSVQQYSKATKTWSEPLRSAVPAVATAWGPRANTLTTVNDQGIITVLGPGT